MAEFRECWHGTVTEMMQSIRSQYIWSYVSLNVSSKPRIALASSKNINKNIIYVIGEEYDYFISDDLAQE